MIWLLMFACLFNAFEFLLVGYEILDSRNRERKGTRICRGIIIDIRVEEGTYGQFKCPVVKYTVDNKDYRFTGEFLPRKSKIGDSISVLYNPSAAYESKVVCDNKFVPLFPFIAAGVLEFVSVICLIIGVIEMLM